MECMQAEYTFMKSEKKKTAIKMKMLVRSSFVVAFMIIIQIVDMLLSIHLQRDMRWYNGSESEMEW